MPLVKIWRKYILAQIQLCGVSKVYDNGNKVVDDFSLTVEDGEFIVFVGPSGCGKSTTLRMIAGLESVTAGDIKIEGKSVNKVAVKDRNIAMVFQSYALYPHMTVYENLAFSLKLRGESKSVIAQKVSEVAQILGLSELLERKPKQLSGGQRQRVALGRAIIRQPQVFLFDEPLSNLDAKLRIQMRGELLKLHKKLNATFIYVTHDQIEAMTMADRIVVMKDGVIQQVDTPISMYRNPNNVFVATFMGSPGINLLKGVLYKRAGKIVLCMENQLEKLVDLPIGFINIDFEKEMDVLVGIRPENLHLHPPILNLALDTMVDLIEETGAEMLVHLDYAGNRISMRTSSHIKLNEDTPLQVYGDMEQMHLFDATTYKRISREVSDAQ